MREDRSAHVEEDEAVREARKAARLKKKLDRKAPNPRALVESLDAPTEREREKMKEIARVKREEARDLQSLRAGGPGEQKAPGSPHVQAKEDREREVAIQRANREMKELKRQSHLFPETEEGLVLLVGWGAPDDVCVIRVGDNARGKGKTVASAIIAMRARSAATSASNPSSE